MIPYGRQSIDDDDIRAVEQVLRGDWLTQGPTVEAFEQALAKKCGARFAVAVANGTAALHAAYVAAGLGAGDEFITSPMTFFATANAGLWQGARPVFVDIDPNTGNIDPTRIEAAITPRTKLIVPIDYTGRPADLGAIKDIARRHHLLVVEDACQALGASYQGKPIGSASDLTAFSFHPVKSITTGEGGAVLTNDEGYYRMMKKFVTHGISKLDLHRPMPGPWYMETHLLGLNYRLTDIQSALGLSQLKKLDGFIARRRALAGRYQQALANVPGIRLPPLDIDAIQSAWHLYVIRFDESFAGRKAEIVLKLREAGVGSQVHHIPVHTDPYYESLGYTAGLCPKAEAWYRSALSIPLYPRLTEAEQDTVIQALKNISESFSRVCPVTKLDIITPENSK